MKGSIRGSRVGLGLYGKERIVWFFLYIDFVEVVGDVLVGDYLGLW